MEAFKEALDSEKTFMIATEESEFVFHMVKGKFYIKRTASKDPRYCLVTKLNGKEKYSEKDLDLGVEIEYMHPRLNKEVSGGMIRSVALR
jgi:hypothetical protein